MPAAAAATTAAATPKNATTPVGVVMVPCTGHASTSDMPPTSPLGMSPSIDDKMRSSAHDYFDRDGYYRDQLDENAVPPEFTGVDHRFIPPPVPVPSPEQEEPLPALGLPTIEAEPLSIEASILHPHLFADANAAVPTTTHHDGGVTGALFTMVSPHAREISTTPLAETASPVGNMMSLQNWPGPSTKMPDVLSPPDRNAWFGYGVLGGEPV
jgi:hypothetical protein